MNNSRPSRITHFAFLIGLLVFSHFAIASELDFLATRSAEHLNVIGIYPPPGQGVEEQIVFYFDQSIQVPESAQNRPMIISPLAQGEFTIGANYISYKFTRRSPARRTPSQSYEITLESGIQSQTGQLLNPLHTKVTFPKPQGQPDHSTLSVTRVNTVHSDYSERFIDLQFSSPVEVGDLRQHLTLSDQNEDHEIPYNIYSEGAQQNVRLQFYPFSEHSLVYRLAIRRGLTSTSGETMQKDYSHTVHFQIAPFAIQNTWWNQEGRKGLGLLINTNQNLGAHITAEDLLKYIEVTPEVPNLQVEFSSWSNRNFQIFGDWLGQTNYRLRVKTGLPYASGMSLDTDIVREITSESIPSYVGFGYPGQFYFPRRSNISLPLETRNLDQANLTLYRLFPSNLVVSLRDLNNGRGSQHFNSQWCEELDTTTLKISGQSHLLISTSLDLDQVFPQDKRGVFCIAARGKDEYPNATKIVLYTDIGILSHWQDTELVLFVHDLFSLKPKESAKVSVYSNKMQLLGEGIADSQGMFHFKGIQTNKGTPYAVVAEYGNDFTYLLLEQREQGKPESLTGMPPYNARAYDAFIYSDRELYRPGETVHLRWIGRINYGDRLNNIPLLLTITKPNGQTLLSQPTTLSSLGTGTLDLETKDSYPTGNYTVRLTVPGSNSSVGSYTFKVEDFVPHRMKTQVEVAEDLWLPNEKYPVVVQANHLFGAPASGRKAEAKVLFRRGQYKPERWSEYAFDNDSQAKLETVSLGEAQTDEVGNATFTFSYIPGADITFPLQAVVLGSVFELGGRAVTNRDTVTFLPTDILLGVAANANPTGEGIEVHAAAIHPDQSPADLQQVSISLERETWDYYVRRYYSHNEPEFSKRYQVVETRTVDLNDGRGSTNFVTDGWGNYRVRVHSEATQQYSTLAFHCYWNRCEVGKPSDPSLISLSLDKERYRIGEEAIVRIESPFNGQGIVVLQDEGIRKIFPVTIDNNAGHVIVPIEEDDFPNVWVECTVIHEVKAGHPQMYPFSSFSMINIPVDNPERQLVITYPALPEEILPEATAEFLVHVVDYEGLPVQAELSLAAVDEGIHGITNYQSPQPYEYFSRSRQPDFRRAHYYDHVLYNFEKASPGGDADLLGRMASTPLRNWIKPVALWSGAVLTDASGYANIQMYIPDYNGQLRLVVVANTDSAVGSASENVYVRQDYMMQVSLPRFLLPGDRMQSRLVLYNTTDEDVNAVVQWSSRGALESTSGETSLSIPAMGESTHTAEFNAMQQIGQAWITWSADILNSSGEVIHSLKEDLPLPVNAPSVYQTVHDLYVLQPNGSIELDNEPMLSNPENEVRLTATANPAGRIQKALQFLVEYPYGCLEQTNSRLMPLYIVRQNQDLVQNALPDSQLDEFIRGGIGRLFMMQTPSGGLAMWPGGNEPYAYGSTYALHFLTLIKRGREFNVPESNFNALKDYVRTLAMSGSDPDMSSLYLRSYALFVLALDGDLDAIQQIERFDTITMPRASRYLLAAALAMNTNDQERVQYYLSQAPSEPYHIREIGHTLNSEIRNLAVEMLSLRYIRGNEDQRAEIANRLITYLEQHPYQTTQETAFIATALGDYLSDLTVNIDQASAQITSATGTHSLQGNTQISLKEKGESLKYRVTNTGEVPLYLNWSYSGIPQDAATVAEHKGMTVKRSIYQGNELHEGRFIQGETYVIALEIRSENDLQNVVIADLLPAGFEVENPRLDPASVPDSILQEAVMPSHLEIRDDKVILAFNDLGSGSKHYYYIVRAVSPGEYQYPGLHAECMYDPSIHSDTEASMIIVEEQ